MHWKPENDDSLYIKLNRSLRDKEEREQLMVDWYPYIKLLIVGLKEHAEPARNDKLFRGQPLPADALPGVQRKYKSQGIVYLWAFTSTSSGISTPAEYAGSTPWLCEFCPPATRGNHPQPGGVVPNAYNIGAISSIPEEREILLLPCSKWKVDIPISNKNRSGTAIKTTSLQAVRQQDWSWLNKFPKLTSAPKKDIIASSSSAVPSSSAPTVLRHNTRRFCNRSPTVQQFQVHRAARRHRVRAVKKLSRSVTTCRAFAGPLDEKQLLEAARCGDVDLVEALCSDAKRKDPSFHPSNIKDVHDWNNTPLLVAAQHGHLSVMKWLVENMKCDLNTERDEDGYTALHAAALCGWRTGGDEMAD
eukprot:TRINITY_DN67461_c1_g1_i4.p1 TRINITY_DN67461_c1_g1~~TRINITY_DN67461_c1_g1_i4.p1  ORF type:complete len:360 (+),score=61.40 TRINITY_DN67461_c1_g1_i4:182-1261(+)